MRVLVTGATGYIGGKLLQRLQLLEQHVGYPVLDDHLSFRAIPSCQSFLGNRPVGKFFFGHLVSPAGKSTFGKFHNITFMH